MKNKPMMMAITIMAVVGMALPLASAGFTNYVFKEDFNGTTLDNSTWVNQSSPFPYEIQNGRMIVHFDTDPSRRYSATDPIPITHNKLHGEINFSIYTSRYQSNSSIANAFVGVIMTNNRTADPVPPLGYDKGIWVNTIASNNPFEGGRYTYSLKIGNKDVEKSESHNYREQQYGMEVHLKYVFNIIIQDNSSMLVNEQLYKNGQLLVVHQDYMNKFNKSMVVFFSVQKWDTRTPVDGYMAIDSIEIGQYSPEQVVQPRVALYEYFMTITMIMFLLSGIALLFYDKAPILDITGVVAFYMALVLLSLFFLTYPYPILSLPAWIFGLLPIVPIAIGVVKAEKMSMFD